MKKIFIVILFVVGFIIGYKGLNYTNDKSPQTIDKNQLDNQIDTIQKELDTYKQKEQEEKLRKLKIQQLQNPEIINNEFIKVGELIVYKGNYTYKDIIREKNWYSKRELNIDFKFNFGMAFNIKNIIINKFIDDVVVLDINKNQIKIQYIELDIKESKIDSTKSILSSEFKPQDIGILAENTQKTVADTIHNNKSIYDTSLDSLKENLKELILKLGYKDVIFNEIYK